MARNFLLWLWILGPFFVYVLIAAFCTKTFGSRFGGAPGGMLGVGIFVFVIIPIIKSERKRIRDNIHAQKRIDEWTGTQVIFNDDRNA